MKELEVTNDYVFKRIFGRQENKEILKDLLISILEIPIENIEILTDVHLDRTMVENKEGILDIKATLNNNITVNIEMQVRNKYNMIDRSLYYWSNLYNNSLYKGQNYARNNKTIAINILGYNIFEEGPYHEKCMITREYNGEILTEDLEMYFIQIPKCTKEKIKTKLDVWIRFIGNIKEEGEQEMSYEIDEETWNALSKAKKILNDLNADPEERRIAELREKAIATEIMSLAGAKEEGIEEGAKKRSLEIAKKLKQMGMNIEDIKKATGLTKEEIEKL